MTVCFIDIVVDIVRTSVAAASTQLFNHLMQLHSTGLRFNTQRLPTALLCMCNAGVRRHHRHRYLSPGSLLKTLSAIIEVFIQHHLPSV